MEGNLPIKLQPANLRPLAYRIFSKKHGLNIKTDALNVLTEIISYHFGAEWRGAKAQQFMEDIAKTWKVEDRGLFLDGDSLLQVLKELNKKRSFIEKSVSDASVLALATRTDTIVDESPPEINWRDHFKIINPPDQPRFRFDRHRKQFTLQPKGAGGLRNHLAAAIEMYSSRYHLLSDRLSRHENFQRPAGHLISSLLGSMDGTATSEISLIKNVVGRDGTVFVLFGQLSKNASGDFILEDASDHIELDLTQAEKTPGCFYTTGMFVVVEGIYSAAGGNSNANNDYIGGVFHVSMLGHPPAERRAVTTENYGHVDFLGVHDQTDDRVTKVTQSWQRKLAAVELSLDAHRLVMLGSDCFLDSSAVMAGLRKYFVGLEARLAEGEAAPLAIVMVGLFSSTALTASPAGGGAGGAVLSTEAYKSGFDRLAALLGECPTVVNTCKLVLVAGKNDPWQSTQSMGSASVSCLPQRALPTVFVSRLTRLFPRGGVVLGWNPLRLSYLTQEWVVFSSELMTTFKRNDIVFASDGETLAGTVLEQATQATVSTSTQQARKLVKTVLDQGTLQPFSPNLRLVDPDYDHVLRVEPLPTVLFLHDTSTDVFEVTYNGCKVVNVGPVVGKGGSRMSYVEYYPARKRAEFRQLYF